MRSGGASHRIACQLCANVILTRRIRIIWWARIDSAPRFDVRPRVHRSLSSHNAHVNHPSSWGRQSTCRLFYCPAGPAYFLATYRSMAVCLARDEQGPILFHCSWVHREGT